MTDPVRIVRRYWHAARHYRSTQLIARVRIQVKRGVLFRVPWFARRYLPHDRVVESPAKLFPSFSGGALSAADVAAMRRCAEDIAARRFTFLNRTYQFTERIDWVSAREERLWRYNLHYGDYLRHLAVLFACEGDRRVLDVLKRTIADWIVENPPPRGVGWRSYPVALRLVNLLYALDLCRDAFRAEAVFHERLLISLYTHTAFLADNLESDSLGNHLIENGKALLLGGLCLAGAAPAQWLRVGSDILWRELDEQILADGGHYERSPMYHAIVLADYVEVASALRSNGVAFPRKVVDKIRAMATWLESLLHPDGEIPLLQDAALGIAPRTVDLLNAARWVVLSEGESARHTSAPGVLSALVGAGSSSSVQETSTAPLRHLAASGYVVLDAPPDVRLIADVGEIGPDHIPAHGHAGLFSFELSHQGRRLIVDSGVSTYEPGPRRDYFRSTRAHTTVTVDDQNQSDVWSSFRAGRRARVTAFGCVQRHGVRAFAGRHNGYEAIRRGLIHTRVASLMDEGALVVVDRIPRAQGLRVRAYVHFHPEVLVRRADSDCFALSTPRGTLRLWMLGRVSASRVRERAAPLLGGYAPEFGLDQPHETVVMDFEQQETAEGGFALTPATWTRPVVTSAFSHASCTVTFASGAMVCDATVVLEPKGGAP